MRQLARKTFQSSIVRRDLETVDRVYVNPASLKRFFHGWQRERTPNGEQILPGRDDQDLGLTRISAFTTTRKMALLARAGLETAYRPKRRRKVTINEMLAVNRATVRESCEHRHWPTDVVLTFMAADVVTARNQRQ